MEKLIQYNPVMFQTTNQTWIMDPYCIAWSHLNGLRTKARSVLVLALYVAVTYPSQNQGC